MVDRHHRKPIASYKVSYSGYYGKKLAISEIDYPIWIESRIALKHPEGNFKIIGRELNNR